MDPPPHFGDQQNVQNKQTSPPKPPVQRGARACTVCRQAKMKCVGAEDGTNGPCQRCKRSGSECIFEKHRRGRKPGSKLSEASKMLRRLEKGLSTAKAKQASDPAPLPSRDAPSPDYHREHTYSPGGTHLHTNQLSPLRLPNDHDPTHSSNRSDVDMDNDTDDQEREETMFPANVIRQEKRNSFLGVVLNQDEPQGSSSRLPAPLDRSNSHSASHSPRTPTLQSGPSLHSPLVSSGPATGLRDPIAAGLIDEESVQVLFDMFYLRLNPFINLFDPALHSVAYIRSKCPFLFTVLLMATCKFFRPNLYPAMQSLSREYAKEAFIDNWKSVEVVQAFACLTYWKEPGDQRTWTYIGYASRMAIDLGLNRYVGKRPYETDTQMRERRNRERTYYVLWVHDRSLCMQTGKHWMLPEDELVRHAINWHKEGGSPPRPEDVIVSAFVNLRHIAAQTLDHMLNPASYGDHEMPLKNFNGQLHDWLNHWQREMETASGTSFHSSFLTLFQLHVRLFLNFAGINASMIAGSRMALNVHALNVCYDSAMGTLRIVSENFASMNVLRYGQETITMISAYSAIVLLKLLRNSNTYRELREGAHRDIHAMITKAAEAYHGASILTPPSSNALHHSRFLRWLVDDNDQRLRQMEKDRYTQAMNPLDTRGQVAPPYPPGSLQMYPPPPPGSLHVDRHFYNPPSSSGFSSHPAPGAISPSSASYSLGPLYRESEYASTTSRSARTNGAQSSSVMSYSPHPASFVSEPDAQYTHNLLSDLGMTTDMSEWPPSLGYQGPGSVPAMDSMGGTLPSLNGLAYRGDASRGHAYPPPYPGSAYQYPPMLGPSSGAYMQQPAFGSGR